MAKTLARLWAYVAVVLPALLGILMLVSAQTALQMTTPEGLAHTAGIRNVVYALVLLVALLSMSNRVVGLLLAGRGLTDLADTIATVVTTGSLAGPVIFPLVTSVISFAAAYYLYFRSAGAAGTSPRSAEPTSGGTA